MLIKLYKKGDATKEFLVAPSQVGQLLAAGYTKEPMKIAPKKVEPVKEEPVKEDDSSNKKRTYVKKTTSDSTGK